MTPPSAASPSARFSWAPASALLLAVAVTVALFYFGQSRFYYDYAWQMMSVRDHARGITDSPFVMRSADPQDLTRDRVEWTIGYPLAYNAAGALLTRAGAPAATAHRLIGTIAVLLGILGWHFVFADCVALDPLARAIAVVSVALSFHGAPMVAFMMPETFLFTAVPWQLWALFHGTADDLPAPRRLLFCVLLGAITGIAYTFRYLAALHGIALLFCAAAWLAWRRPSGWIRAGAGAAIAAALPVVVLSAANYLHLGAINSVSDRLPWGAMLHWPDLNKWLLAAFGPAQALFGAGMLFSRLATALGTFLRAIHDFDSQLTASLLLAAPTTALAAMLIRQFAPRDRLLAFALAGALGVSVGLLWIYSRSRLPQPDPRYFSATALLLLPSLTVALSRALRSDWRWRSLGVLACAPYFAAVAIALYASALNLRAAAPGKRGGVIAGSRVDPAELQAAVRRRLAHPADEIVWMCFQPSVLQALDGRHVFESYARQPVDYRASHPVTLVVLRDKARAMSPPTYENNYRSLKIAGTEPDFEHGDYDVFLRRIGPNGLIHPGPAARRTD